jgi:hypothetical protein
MYIQIDIAEQNAYKIPMQSTQNSLAHTIGSKFVGVYVAGLGLFLFHYWASVSKGANLTITCLEKVIAVWAKRKFGRRPKCVHVHFDGGSENANKTVLSWADFALETGIVSNIITLDRAPPGHTHGRIDGSFSVMAGALTSAGLIGTIPDIERILKNTLQKPVKVFQVDWVRDYVAFFKDGRDKKFNRAFKEDWTQLCWKFQTVVGADGVVKVMCQYRAYPAGKVVELRVVEKDAAVTDLGKVCGVDPVTVLSQWYPRPSTLNLGHHGYPYTVTYRQLGCTEVMPIAVIEVDAIPTKKQAIEEIRETFPGDSYIVDFWNAWGKERDAPHADWPEAVGMMDANNTAHYFDHEMQYRGSKFPRNDDDKRSLISLEDLTEDGFQWPSELVECRLASVVTRFDVDRGPVPPAVQLFAGRGHEYVRELEGELTEILRLRPVEAAFVGNLDRLYMMANMKPSGGLPHQELTEPAKAVWRRNLLERWMAFYIAYVVTGLVKTEEVGAIVKQNEGAQHNSVLRRLNFSAMCAKSKKKADSQTRVEITESDVREVGGGAACGVNVAAKLAALALWRENAIMSLTFDKEVDVYKKSLWFGDDFAEALMANQFEVVTDMLLKAGAHSNVVGICMALVTDVRYVFCMFRDRLEDNVARTDRFVGIAMDTTNKMFYFVDPRLQVNDHDDVSRCKEKRIKYAKKWEDYLKRVASTDGWTQQHVAALGYSMTDLHQYQGEDDILNSFPPVLDSDNDSLVVVFACFESLFRCCPARWRKSDYMTLRRTIAESFYRCKLPTFV